MAEQQERLRFPGRMSLSPVPTAAVSPSISIASIATLSALRSLRLLAQASSTRLPGYGPTSPQDRVMLARRLSQSRAGTPEASRHRPPAPLESWSQMSDL